MQNLDLACANCGRKLAKIRNDQEQADETVFTRALGVLEEQGPYACSLYLKAREGKIGSQITVEAAKFLREFLRQQVSDNELEDVNDEDMCQLRKICASLDNLLFARDLLRQVFVYARYHAKTKEGRGGGEET